MRTVIDIARVLRERKNISVKVRKFFFKLYLKVLDILVPIKRNGYY